MEKKMQIRFTGRIAEKHKVPVSIINDVLTGLQRAVYLLAMQHEGIDVRQKDRITGTIEEKYVLLCEPPMPGSLLLNVSLGDPMYDLYAQDDIESVSNNLSDFSRSLLECDERRTREIIPDRQRRKRLIEAIGKTIPKGSSGVSVEAGWNGEAFLFSTKLNQVLPIFRESSSSDEEIRTVTGRLVRIDFDERKLTILYQPTGRELECFYEESAEEMLLDRPRELIQVTGVIRMDQHGPKKIVNVDKIQELDLSRFYCDSYEYPDYILKFIPTLILTPSLEEEQQLLSLRDESLGIDVFAYTVEELSDSLWDEIDMLWNNYALKDDDILTEKAQIIKRNLKKRIQMERKNG